MAFKMRGPSGLKQTKKKKEIKDNIGYDELYDIYYDKDIQKSYEQRRGRFGPKKPKKNNQQNTDRLV